MKNFRELSDVEVDRLIEGVGQAWDPAITELNTFVQEVRAAYAQPISRAAEMRHIEAMVKQARSRRWSSSVLTKQLEGLKASLPPLFRPLSLRTRRIVFANLVGSAVGKAVLALTAAAATTTGLAATGSLPAPIQAVVISAAHNLGISAEPTPSPAQPPPPVPVVLPEIPASEPVPPAVTTEGATPAEPPPETVANGQPPGNAEVGAPRGTARSTPDFTESNRGSVAGNARSGSKQDAPSAENEPANWWDYYNEPNKEKSSQTGAKPHPNDKEAGDSHNRGSWNWSSEAWWKSWQGTSSQGGRR